MSDCEPRQLMGSIEIPNCSDPVFRAWCSVCQLEPGSVVPSSDPRVARLQQLMHGAGELDYDPYQDPLDDPFPEERLPY